MRYDEILFYRRLHLVQQDSCLIRSVFDGSISGEERVLIPVVEAEQQVSAIGSLVSQTKIITQARREVGKGAD